MYSFKSLCGEKKKSTTSMFSFLEKMKILQRLILKYSSSTNCLITKVHSYNLDPIKLLNAKKIFNKNVEIGVQENYEECNYSSKVFQNSRNYKS